MSPAVDIRETPPLEDDLREKLASEMERRQEEHGAKTAGQTMLGHGDNCLRAAAFYLIFGGGVATHATTRGMVCHLFSEQARNYLLEVEEPSMPPEVGKTRMQALIDERTDLVLPEVEQEACRIFAWNWAAATIIDPSTLVCNETMLSLEIGGWTVRGKIDRADILLTRDVVIRDEKSGLNLPAQEAYENSFQGKTYALLFAEGVVEGEGIELGKGLPTFYTREEYPRLEPDRETGELRHREAVYTRAELYDFRLALERLLRQLDENLESGEWPAVSGSHCKRCPAPAFCPIPEQFREEADLGNSIRPQPAIKVESLAHAEQLAEEELFVDARHTVLRTAIREWAREHGPLPAGSDFIWDFGDQQSASLKDFDAFTLAIERTAEYGESFDLEKHLKRRSSTPFRRRKRTAEEAV